MVYLALKSKWGAFEVLSTIQDKSGIYEATKSHAFPFTMEMLGRNTAACIAFLADFLIRLFVIFLQNECIPLRDTLIHSYRDTHTAFVGNLMTMAVMVPLFASALDFVFDKALCNASAPVWS